MNILWICRRPVLEGGGDAVVDRMFPRALGRNHEVTVIELLRGSTRDRLTSSVRQAIPPDRSAWGNRGTVDELARVARTGFDAVVVAHEQLDHVARRLGHALKGTGIPVALLLHNVPSDQLPQIAPNRALARLSSMVWTVYERRSLADPAMSSVFVLSHRDARLVRELSGRRDDVVVVHPGPPPPIQLAPGSRLRPELVILGTFEWWPKRRDMLTLAAEWSAIPLARRLPIYLSAAEDTEMIRRFGARTTDELDLSSAVRFGVVPDRFVSGHKLKVSEYLVKNLIPISFSEVTEDFAYSEAAKRLISPVTSAESLLRATDRLRSRPAEELVKLVLKAKSDVVATMSWDRQSAILGDRLSQDIERIRNVRS